METPNNPVTKYLQGGDKYVFLLGREVVYALPRESSALRPSPQELKFAAEKLGISVRKARKALDLYNFG